jgi:hypothetical protein
MEVAGSSSPATRIYHQIEEMFCCKTRKNKKKFESGYNRDQSGLAMAIRPENQF